MNASETADQTAIGTLGLCKTYRTARGKVAALRGVDLRVAQGEFFGLLGPNGAGKSTAIGVLTTLVKPTAGTARVWHRDVAADPIGVRRCIGVTTQGPNFDRHLTVGENLEFRGRYCGMRGREARRRAAQLLEEFGLGDRRKAHVHELSGGQAKRLMIARALVQRPQVLFLDEPTAGIDPQTRLHLWDILRRLHADGLTILLTTHYLEEAEQLCQRIAVLDHGQVLACGTLGELSAAAGAPMADDAAQWPSLESVFLALTGRDYRE